MSLSNKDIDIEEIHPQGEIVFKTNIPDAFSPRKSLRTFLTKAVLSAGIIGAGFLGINAGAPSLSEGILKAFKGPKKAFAFSRESSNPQDYTNLPSLVDQCPIVHPKDWPNYPIKTMVLKGIKISFPGQTAEEITTQSAIIDQYYQSWMINQVDSFHNYFLGIRVQGEVKAGIIMANKPTNQYSNPGELADEIRNKIPSSDYAYDSALKKFNLLNYIPLPFYNAVGRTLGSYGEMMAPSFIYERQNQRDIGTIRHESLHGIGIPHSENPQSIMNQDATSNADAGITLDNINGVCEKLPTPTPTPTNTPIPTPTPVLPIYRIYIPDVSKAFTNP